MRRAIIAVASTLTVVLSGVTGCGSGSQHSAPSTSTVDVSKLDVGGYTIVPYKVGKPNLERAKLSEGQELASYLPLPMDIDPQFKYQSGTSSLAVRGFLSDAQGISFPTNNIDTNAPGFVSGFNVEGRSDPNIPIASVLLYDVLIFTDDKAASNGAAVLATEQFNQQSVKPNSQATSIDGHSDTRAIWLPGADAIESFTSDGEYVIYTSVSDNAMEQVNSTDLPEISRLTRKTIEDISSALKNFKPTPVTQLTDMKIDHDGMGARSMQKMNGDEGLDLPGIYNQRGALMLSDDPAADKDLYTRTGMDWMVLNAGRVYRTRDGEAAAELLDARSVVPRMYKIADPPPNLPEAHCDEYKDRLTVEHPRFHCVVSYGRYVAEMWSEQLIDVHQRISAQYALLTKS